MKLLTLSLHSSNKETKVTKKNNFLKDTLLRRSRMTLSLDDPTSKLELTFYHTDYITNNRRHLLKSPVMTSNAKGVYIDGVWCLKIKELNIKENSVKT